MKIHCYGSQDSYKRLQYVQKPIAYAGSQAYTFYP
jgi:hypothetical protein